MYMTRVYSGYFLKELFMLRFIKQHSMVKLLAAFWSFCILNGCQDSNSGSVKGVRYEQDTAAIVATEKHIPVVPDSTRCLNCKAPSARSLLLKNDRGEGNMEKPKMAVSGN